MLTSLQHSPETQFMTIFLSRVWCKSHVSKKYSVLWENLPCVLITFKQCLQIIPLKLLEGCPHPPEALKSRSEGYLQAFFRSKSCLKDLYSWVWMPDSWDHYPILSKSADGRHKCYLRILGSCSNSDSGRWMLKRSEKRWCIGIWWTRCRASCWGYTEIFKPANKEM